MKLSNLVAIVAALFLLFGVSREARAQNTETITLTNNTSATLTYQGTDGWDYTTGWSNQQWVTTNPSGDTRFVPGPPATLNPGQSVVMYAQATGAFSNGTGGTIAYGLEPAAGNVIPTDPLNPPQAGQSAPTPTYTVRFQWTSPSSSGSGIGLPGGDQTDGFVEVDWPNPFAKGGADELKAQGEFGYTVTAPFFNNGQAVTFQLDGPPPIASVAASTSFGSANTAVFIAGNNLPAGYTTVAFGGVPALDLGCAGTYCGMRAPPGSGVVPVTATVFGQTATVGSFTYTPSCAYSSINGVEVECTPDTNNDPIWIFQQNGSGWSMVYNYPVAGGRTEDLFENPPNGTTATFVGCFSLGGQFPYPGTPGCDVPASVTVHDIRIIRHTPE